MRALLRWPSREEDKRQQADQHGDAGDADEVGGPAAVGALFLAGIEQHDDEGEEHHDGAGVDDDLGGGEELGAEQQVEHRQRTHHDDQRERAVDRVALEKEVQGSRHAKTAEDEEEKQVHASVRSSKTLKGTKESSIRLKPERRL